ncbi:MAG: glycosyltransferase family 4 protein [Hydrogenophaga sp.]|nr:glycosyltransferase family 4 protein [Hydrogenophaga sp.]
MANHWVNCGWQVSIVTLTPKKLDFYELQPAVKRIALDLASDSPTPIAGVINNLKRARALRRVLRQIEPDIALGMMSTANVLLCLASVGISRTRVIASERTYPPALPLGRFWERIRRWTYPLADRVTLLTREGLDWLEKEIPKARGIVVPNHIPYPLPLSNPCLVPADWLEPDRRILLAVGRLSEEKGFDQLLQVFAELAPTNPDWDLVILGEGPLRSQLEQQVHALGLTHRVYLPGRVGNVGDWYARADLYVMSSRFEGFPNTLGEAMAYGCAAVSFDCDTGPRDIIRHEVDGLLVPAGDTKGLGVALQRLMSDDDLRDQMGDRAIEVRERFSMEKIMGLWESLFAAEKT